MRNLILKLFFILILLSSSALFAADRPKVKISSETTDYLKKGLANSCKYLGSLSNYFFTLYKVSIEDTGNLNSYNVTSFKTYLEDLGCSADFIKNFNKMVNKDVLPLHQYTLDMIKDDIKDFQIKGFSASFQIAKYKNYEKDNDLENLKLSSETLSLYDKTKEQSNTRKQTCTDVMNLKAPLSLDKPKNQDSIGWCYAYAASDIIAHVLGRDPSAVHLANLVNGKFFFKLFGVKEGGFVDSAIKEMVDNGLCLEKDLPSMDYRFSLKDYRNINDIFDKVKDLAKEYNNAVDKKIVAGELCSKNKDLLIGLREVFPGLNVEQIAEILVKSSPSDAFRKMANSCPVVRDEAVKSLKVRSVSNADMIFPTMDEQLSAGNIVGIHYSADVLSDYKSFTFADHASTIVGRRFNPKTLSCEYLLRNSWGQSCTMYSTDYECKNGHAWVGEEFFKYNKSIQEVIYAEK